MAILLLSTTPSLSCLYAQSTSLTVSTPAITVTHLPRLQIRFVKPNLLNGLQSCAPFLIKGRGAVVVKATSEIDSTGSDSANPLPEVKEESVLIENIPLESKLKIMQEQKLKMKLAKKIRLRRKRLVRKRHLRKKGRWPPSKMKKNKNI